MELRAYPGCEVDWHFDYVAEGVPENEWGESEVIFIKLQARDAVLNWPEDGRPTKEFDWDTLGDMSNTEVAMFKRDEFVSKDRNQALQDLSSLLSLMGFPSIFQATFAREIYFYASNFAKDRSNRGRRVIPLSMSFDIFQYLGDEDEILDEVMGSPLSDDDDMDGDDDEGSSSDEEEEGFSSDDDDEEMDEGVDDDIIDSMVPATKASIDSLQKAKAEDQTETDDSRRRMCMICLEELSTSSSSSTSSSQAISRMPCSHLYHADCLIRWLETSHVCPLCRFEMPTAAIS